MVRLGRRVVCITNFIVCQELPAKSAASLLGCWPSQCMGRLRSYVRLAASRCLRTDLSQACMCMEESEALSVVWPLSKVHRLFLWFKKHQSTKEISNNLKRGKMWRGCKVFIVHTSKRDTCPSQIQKTIKKPKPCNNHPLERRMDSDNKSLNFNLTIRS